MTQFMALTKAYTRETFMVRKLAVSMYGVYGDGEQREGTWFYLYADPSIHTCAERFDEFKQLLNTE